MTEQEITELRARIAEIEERDQDFARKSNLLLDEILVGREQADKNTNAIAENAKAIAENRRDGAEGRRDIDQLAERIGQVAQEISDLRQIVQLVAFTSSQTFESVTIVSKAQQTTTERFVEAFTRFQEQAAVDREDFRNEIRQIWEYLLQQRPNGSQG